MTIILKKNTEYTLLFWADKGTAATDDVASSGYWNTDDLQAVTVSEAEKNKVGQVAYCCKLDINSRDLKPNHRISLKNATTQVNFIEAVGLATSDNTLKVTYGTVTTLNVGTGEVSEVTVAMTHTFTGIAQVAKDVIFAEDYILSPLGEENLINLAVQFNSEPEKQIANVPFEQNHRTNIKGEYSNLYSSVFTVSNEVVDYWNKPDVVIGAAKVGDFYMEDGTWLPGATVLTDDQKAACIGIVYEVNPDGISGKVVGLNEGTDLAWSTESIETGAASSEDGRANMATVAAFISNNNKSWDAYPAFKWVAQQNGKADGGWDDADKWYLPATYELWGLYTAWNGVLSNVANTTLRDTFNARLTLVGGTGLGGAPGTYVGSKDYYSSYSQHITFNPGYNLTNLPKTDKVFTRCIMLF